MRTLVFYDEPQLALLRPDNSDIILGVAIPEYRDMEYPFFAYETRQRTFERYLDGKSDLNYLFRDAFRERYYFFGSAEADENEIILSQDDEEEVNNPVILAATWSIFALPYSGLQN